MPTEKEIRARACCNAIIDATDEYDATTTMAALLIASGVMLAAMSQNEETLWSGMALAERQIRAATIEAWNKRLQLQRDAQ
jgi:hypothetical protein